ncbi:DUF3426 domain-containing protein [Massilia sp. METH4]|uniref:zinc-ribbon and DUF3426 domain-containing protein n=1 Tax=Massilia sp. METH4 TaxID=3123041 RepID=UPI0030D56A6C
MFRVALDQLKLRGGIVRCGACNEIFDGNAALVEPGAAVVVAPLPVPVSSPAAPKLDLELDLDEQATAVVDEPAAVDKGSEGSAGPDAGTVPPARSSAPRNPGSTPQGPPPESIADSEEATETLTEPSPEPESRRGSEADASRREPALDTPSEHLVAAALDDLHHFDEAPEPIVPVRLEAPEPDTGRAANEAADRTADDAAAADLLTAAPDSALLAAGAGAAAAPAEERGEDDEAPGFVRQAERRERTRNLSRLAMIAGIPLLAFVLLGQGVYSLRNRLAADYPSLKPALQALCGPLGCTVELPRQIDALAIEQGELQTLAPNTFSFVTVLRNQSRTVQAWPHIELVLNDAAEKPVLRRVFAPRDYLAKPADVAAGFRPRSEQAVKLYFELDGLRASGYHIAIFHP